jgi:hypothetical protein
VVVADGMDIVAEEETGGCWPVVGKEGAGTEIEVN